jgi:acetyltransferase-like isoleucine patch superfamily enzyme
MIHESVRLLGNNQLGKNCCILENVIVGYPDALTLAKLNDQGLKIGEYKYPGASIGESALLRPNTVIYCGVSAGKNFHTGHNVLIRESTIIGDNVSIGSYSIIEGHVSIGNNVNIQSNVYIATNSAIEDYVFIGPNAVLTNDKYPPLRKGGGLKGPILRTGVSVGAAALILPGVEIGEGSMIAAGAIVTKNVPGWKLVIGSPAKMVDLPEELKVINKI